LYSPIAGHIFLTKAVQNLYIAKTKNANMFKKKRGPRGIARERKLNQYIDMLHQNPGIVENYDKIHEE
jgi:ribosomal protein L24E